MHSFMQRHNFSNRKAESTSAARAQGFNEESVAKFFKLLKQLMDKCNFNPQNIWNCDETGVIVNPKSGSTVISTKGKKQVGGKITVDRGELVTAEICFSAAGVYMPPLLIFPRVKVNEEY